VPRISEIDSIEKVIIQVWSLPLSLYGKSKEITGMPKHGEAFMAIISPTQERVISVLMEEINESRQFVSNSLEIKN
jgi:hypothetical protein